jgi:hypothetical protein
MRNHLTRIWSQILLYVNHKTVSHENISYDLPIRNLVPNSCKMISHLFFIRILLFQWLGLRYIEKSIFTFLF